MHERTCLLLPIALLCTLTACGGGGPISAPSIRLSTTTVTFADQQPGSISPGNDVTISNAGNAPLTISMVQLTGSGAGAFAEADNCGAVAPGGHCTVTVRFHPGALGIASATLTVTSNAPSSPNTVTLSGKAVATATWMTLANAPPAELQLCLLLTDASLLCQTAAGQDWYRLTPDSNGSYEQGTWSAAASFPASYIPQAFASAVLADGRVAVVGGEYTTTNGQTNFALSDMGMLFDPVANRWQPLNPPPSTGSPNHWLCIGDAPAAVLADGHLVIGSKLYKDVTVLDPATLTWSNIAGSGKTDTFNAEEGWTLLPDGSVLTLAVASAPAAERLVLSNGDTNGIWVSAGATPADLHTRSPDKTALTAPGCPSYSPPGEMGPALLRPDGSVFAIGANGLTAVYSPASNSWASGPSVPNGLNIQDGPAVVLPSGHVLFGASPGAAGTGLEYFEFDGVQLSSAPAPAGSGADATFFTSLLPLPTGQVLFVDGTQTVQIYSPALSPGPAAAWAPVITAVAATIAPGSTYRITGTQFNGLTQASAFGDESQNATNYPLVRITNQASGHVFYARTHDHSTMGVATGSLSVATDFDVPAAAESGASTLQVVANGIASAGVAVMVHP
ncbi:MAG: choice-of-anchor D domain-containing protein [Sinobacteraceae bacterium]|nr:choice-of-anchor D domain-containing protein [Nevskiaceae bacterium]